MEATDASANGSQGFLQPGSSVGVREGRELGTWGGKVQEFQMLNLAIVQFEERGHFKSGKSFREPGERDSAL